VFLCLVQYSKEQIQILLRLVCSLLGRNWTERTGNIFAVTTTNWRQMLVRVIRVWEKAERK